MIQFFRKEFLGKFPDIIRYDGEVIEVKVLMISPMGPVVPGEYRVIGEAGDFVWGERF